MISYRAHPLGGPPDWSSHASSQHHLAAAHRPWPLALTVQLAACVSLRRDPAHFPLPPERGLQRFDSLCRFLPDEMESYWFGDDRLLPLDDLEPDHPVLVAIAGRNFQPPRRPGLGDLDYVLVMDFGSRRIAENDLDEPGARQPGSIAGCPVWLRPERGEGRNFVAAQWTAIVADRFMVQASSPDLLQQALALGGDRARSLAFLPDLSAIADDAADVICCKARPDAVPIYGVAPASATIFQVRCRSLTIEVLSLRPAAGYFDAIGFRQQASGTAMVGPYHLATFELEDATTRWMLVHVAFGFELFI